MRQLRLVALGLRGIPDVQGGVETHAQHLYPRLVRLGCNVVVLGRSTYIRSGVVQGVRVVALVSPRGIGLEAFVHTFVGVLWAAVCRPDVLHVHAIGPGVMVPLARLLGLRVVFTHHGQDYLREKWGRTAKWVLKLGEFAAVRWANSTIVVSTEIQSTIERIYGVKTTVIPNGVQLPRPVETVVTLKELGLSPRRYILTVGRLVPEKRHLDLLAAYRYLRDAGWAIGWNLVIVGAADHGSNYAQRIQAAISETDGVVLAGFRSGTPLAELYANAGIFCLPSSHEGLPISMLEALSYGLPVVASDIGPNRAVGLGVDSHYPLGDIGGLADTLLKTMRRGIVTAECLKRTDFVRRHFDWDTVASATWDLVRAAAEPNS